MSEAERILQDSLEEQGLEINDPNVYTAVLNAINDALCRNTDENDYYTLDEIE